MSVNYPFVFFLSTSTITDLLLRAIISAGAKESIVDAPAARGQPYITEPKAWVKQRPNDWKPINTYKMRYLHHL